VRGRLTRADRVDQLLLILQDRYSEAQSQGDFTARSLSREAGVSVVWFYALVGRQFKVLRSNLKGPILSDESLVNKLRREVERLRNKSKELKAKYEASLKEKLFEAIRHIELLDGENRLLRERVARLEKRLDDCKLIVDP
jgi:hypothetical protein